MMTSVWRLRLRGRHLGRAERRLALGGRGVAGMGAGVLIGALCALGAASAQQAPAGMVPYDHPVYHNGVRVLWHGAWRGKGKTSSDSKAKADESAASATDGDAPSAEAKPAVEDAKPAAEAATEAPAQESGLPTKLPRTVAKPRQTAKEPVAVAAKSPPGSVAPNSTPADAGIHDPGRRRRRLRDAHGRRIRQRAHGQRRAGPCRRRADVAGRAGKARSRTTRRISRSSRSTA